MIYMGNYLPDDSASQTKSQTRSWEKEMFVKDLVAIGEREACVKDDFQGVRKEGVLCAFVNMFKDVKMAGFVITHVMIVCKGVRCPQTRVMDPIFDGKKQK